MIAWLRSLNLRQFCGVVLLTVSTLLWLAIPAVPFLPLETSTKVAAGAGVFIAAEVTFYPGLALLGKESVDLMRSWWNRLKRKVGFGKKTD